MTTLQSLSTPTTMGASSRAVRASTPGLRRIIAAVVFGGCTVLLGVAAWLEPSATGLGTHTQLHLPACGWITIADLPCPTCGMTTAFAHAANGDLPRSFMAQPLGCILAVSAAMIWLISVQVIITGSRLGAAVSRLWNRWVAWGLAFALVAAWGFTIARHKGWF